MPELGVEREAQHIQFRLDLRHFRPGEMTIQTIVLPGHDMKRHQHKLTKGWRQKFPRHLREFDAGGSALGTPHRRAHPVARLLQLTQ